MVAEVVDIKELVDKIKIGYDKLKDKEFVLEYDSNDKKVFYLKFYLTPKDAYVKVAICLKYSPFSNMLITYYEKDEGNTSIQRIWSSAKSIEGATTTEYSFLVDEYIQLCNMLAYAIT